VEASGGGVAVEKGAEKRGEAARARGAGRAADSPAGGGTGGEGPVSAGARPRSRLSAPQAAWLGEWGGGGSRAAGSSPLPTCLALLQPAPSGLLGLPAVTRRRRWELGGGVAHWVRCLRGAWVGGVKYVFSKCF